MKTIFLHTIRARAFVAWCALHIACFCSSHSPFESNFDALKRQPVRQLKSYKCDFNSPLIVRIKPVPPFLLEEIKKMDGRNDYGMYAFSDLEKKEIEKYLNLLPKHFKQVLHKRLIGIYGISPFMGAGLADWVMDEKEDIYAILIVNPEVMKKALSEWLTYREKSCFIFDKQMIEIFVDAGSTYSALMYLLLHESAHIVDYVENHTPYVELPLRARAMHKVFDVPFVKNIWDNYAQPKKEFDFPMRDRITFYGLSNGPKIPLSKAMELYNHLMNSPFVSLYATQNWAEDFAETFMVYHIVYKLNQPFRIVITKNGKKYAEYFVGIEEQQKKRFDYFMKFY